jgi:hypothetical protein
LIVKYLLGIKTHLKKNGNAYFTFSSLSDREKLNKYLKKIGMKYKVVSSRKYGDEKIDVYCMS